MHTLAGSHHVAHGPAACCYGHVAVFVAQGVHPDAGGIDDTPGVHCNALPRLSILAAQARHLAIGVQQPLHRAVIDQQGPGLGCCFCQRDGQAGIVKLAVPVFDAALQAPWVDARQRSQCAVAAQKPRLAQPRFAGQHVVHHQPQAVKRGFPPLIRRHHKGQRLGQMRRVVQQRGALVQGLVNQTDIALGQVAHTAVQQLGGTRRCALGKVMRLQQHHAQASTGSIQRHAQAGRATAHDGDVVLRAISQASDQRIALGGQDRTARQSRCGYFSVGG